MSDDTDPCCDFIPIINGQVLHEDDCPARPIPYSLAVPPFRPDPEVMANAEGNVRDLARDKAPWRNFISGGYNNIKAGANVPTPTLAALERLVTTLEATPLYGATKDELDAVEAACSHARDVIAEARLAE